LHLEEYWRGADFPLGVVAIEWASKLINVPPQHLKINLAVPNNSEASPKVQDFAEDLEEEYLKYLPQERIIHLIAQGQKYVEILQQFQV
jgi:tRNA threonylcarbamoyladenosine biosynthesis protein TsaE